MCGFVTVWTKCRWKITFWWSCLIAPLTHSAVSSIFKVAVRERELFEEIRLFLSLHFLASPFFSLLSCDLHFFCLLCWISVSVIAFRLIAAWGNMRIMEWLSTACNLLKFKMIFWSPVGSRFVSSTAVTNRCNLLIMVPVKCVIYSVEDIDIRHFNMASDVTMLYSHIFQCCVSAAGLWNVAQKRSGFIKECHNFM